MIKEISREELRAFLMRYAERLLEKDLRQIKGIGNKHVEEIMAVFEKHLGV